MLAGTVKADFITSQVSCFVSDTGAVTATNFCSLAGNLGTSATASVNTSFTLPTSPGPLSLVTSGEGFARGYRDNFTGIAADFSESISIQLTLDTPGDPRPGFRLITGDGALLSGSFDTGYSESIFGFSTLPPSGLPLRPLPVTLGEPFTFTYKQGMACFENALNSICGSNKYFLAVRTPPL